MTNRETDKQKRLEVKINLSKKPEFNDVGALKTWVKENLSFLPVAAKEKLLKLLEDKEDKKN